MWRRFSQFVVFSELFRALSGAGATRKANVLAESRTPSVASGEVSAEGKMGDDEKNLKISLDFSGAVE